MSAILEEILRTRGELGSTEVAKAALQRWSVFGMPTCVK
jgi:hypothetical protein